MRRIAMIVIASLVFVSAADAAGNWDYEVGIYGWLTGLEGTMGVADVVEQPVDITFEDLAGFVDFAIAGHFEARGTKVVWIGDVAYNNLGSERDAQVGNQTVKVDGDMQQWIVEFGGGYAVAKKLDLILAGRYYYLDTGATFSLEGEEQANSVNKAWVDVFLGARYNLTFGEKWFGSIRGDIGAGGSEFAWFGQVVLGYNISESWGATLGYRLLSTDYEGGNDADYFRYDMTQSGLGLGVGYRF